METNYNFNKDLPCDNRNAFRVKHTSRKSPSLIWFSSNQENSRQDLKLRQKRQNFVTTSLAVFASPSRSNKNQKSKKKIKLTYEAAGKKNNFYFDKLNGS